MKKYLCVCLSVFLVFFALPALAEAEGEGESSCGQSLVWSFHRASATLQITGQGEMTHFSPNHRAPWQEYGGEIEHLVIGEGVTGIGNYAFSNIYAQTVALPSSLLEIGDHAFGNSGLTSLEIPASVMLVGEYAFTCSERLATVVMHAGNGLQIGANAFSGCAALQTVILPQSPLSIGAKAFFGTAVRTLEIPEGVTAVSEEAFASMPLLKSVRVAGSVKEIGARAFAGCEKLEEIALEEGTEEIGAEAFAGYCRLASVVFPDSVKTIGSKAFYNCNYLEQAVFGNQLAYIGDSAFCKTALKEVCLPASLSYAFSAFDPTASVYRTIGTQRRLCGDCDGDNNLNAGDLLHLQNRVLSDGKEDVFADVNIDSKVNILDMVRLKKLLAESSFLIS